MLSPLRGSPERSEGRGVLSPLRLKGRNFPTTLVRLT